MPCCLTSKVASTVSSTIAGPKEKHWTLLSAAAQIPPTQQGSHIRLRILLYSFESRATWRLASSAGAPADCNVSTLWVCMQQVCAYQHILSMLPANQSKTSNLFLGQSCMCLLYRVKERSKRLIKLKMSEVKPTTTCRCICAVRDANLIHRQQQPEP